VRPGCAGGWPKPAPVGGSKGKASGSRYVQQNLQVRERVVTIRPIIALVAGLLLALGVGAGIGVAVAQKGALPKQAGDKSGFEGWKYPGAKELASGQGAGGHQAVLATTDGLDKVVAFYEKKTGEKLTPDQPGGSGIGGENGVGGKVVESRVFQDDSVQPGAQSEPRPVVVRILVQRAKGYDLTLVVRRAKGEEHTHVALTYFPK
jgi:hypothetical protein